MENIDINLVPPTDDADAEDGNRHLENINVNAARNKKLTGCGVRIGSLDSGIDGGYAFKSGASMATSAAAGAAALLIQKDLCYAQHPGSLKAALVALVDPSSVGAPANRAQGYSRIGSGRLDLTWVYHADGRFPAASR